MAKQLRNTKQKEILNKEIGKIESFFDSDYLFNKVKKKDPKIGIATVYRFLNELVKKGEIYSYECERRKIYSRNKKSHCHYECEKTGKIIHFELEDLNFLKEIKSKIPGTINSIQIEIKGICKNCKG